MSDQGPSRRAVLELAAGVTGAAAIGATGLAVADSKTQSDDETAPSVEWVEAYENREQEYEIERIADVHQTDEGYVLSGEGRPLTPTGPEDLQFMLVQTGPEGEQRNIAFTKPDREVENHATHELVKLTGGGYALVGSLRQRTPDYRVESVSVAAAAKFSTAGEPQWTATMDNLESGSGTETETADGEGKEDPGDVHFAAAAADEDGGFVAGGGRTDGHGANPTGILVRYTSDGTLAWERRYDGLEQVDQVFDRDGGYILVGTDGERPVARVVDEEGTVERSFTMDVNLDETSYNHVFTPTADGGYAYTGRDGAMENVVLGRLDADGERLWREEYDGPYEGGDWGHDVIQTTDGGYAIGGYMSEAYSGDSVPAVVKTDPEGTKEWQKLLKDEADSGRVDTFVQTADGGFACQLLGRNVVKLGPAPDDGSESTETPTETDQPTDEPTDTPAETDEPTEGPPETETTDAPAPNTEESTPTETESGTDDSGEDCEI